MHLRGHKHLVHDNPVLTDFVMNTLATPCKETRGVAGKGDQAAVWVD